MNHTIVKYLLAIGGACLVCIFFLWEPNHPRQFLYTKRELYVSIHPPYRDSFIEKQERLVKIIATLAKSYAEKDVVIIGPVMRQNYSSSGDSCGALTFAVYMLYKAGKEDESMADIITDNIVAELSKTVNEETVNEPANRRRTSR